MNNNNNNNMSARSRGQYIADPNAEVIPFDEIQAAMGMHGERVPAGDLVGKTFDIIRAKPFRSAKFEGKTAYFCVIRVDGSEEDNTVILGGVAIIESIADIVSMGLVNPVRVTLLRNEGDKDTDRYYYFG